MSVFEQFPAPVLSACAVGGVLIFIIYNVWRRAFPTPIPGIPYDVEASKSLAGDLRTLQSDPDGLASWCAKHLTRLRTPVCQVLMGPFSKPMVLVADVGDARDYMMRSEFERSAYIIDRFVLFGGSQIRAHTDEQWRTSRGWLKDLLSPSYMRTVVGPSIHASVLQLLELWETSTRVVGPGRSFSIAQDMKDLALDVMTQFHHGAEFQDLAIPRQTRHVEMVNLTKGDVGVNDEVEFSHAPQNVFGESVMEIGDRMAAIYAMAWPPSLTSWLTKHAMPRYRTWFAAKQSLLRQRFETAKQRLRQDEKAQNAIDYMVFQEDKASKKAGRPPMFDDQIMIDEAFGNHIAGLHTTSSAMVWIMKYLTENQEVQGKVVEELKVTFPVAVQEGRPPTCAELMGADLPYIEAVIEETLRLRAAFIIARDTVRDTDVLGYHIPAGTVCLLICQGVEEVAALASSKSQKAPRRYTGNGDANVDKFDPERWLIRNSGGRVTFDGSCNPQMAFGLGVRACWGRKVAELEMKMMTAMVSWCFQLLPVPEALAGHEAQYDFSFRAQNAFVRLSKRTIEDE